MIIGRPTHGFLVLADISGFTEFVTTTELEHGPPIIAALLEEVIKRISPPLEVQELEGDAVFALGVDGALVPPAALLDVLSAGFAGFESRQRKLQADQSCPCNACRSIWRLRLKMICHHGMFLRQTVGDLVQVAGSDVILVHRLLKNRLHGKTQYTLLTRPALSCMEVDPRRAGLFAHIERDEHFGDIECFIADPVPVTAGAAA